MLIYVFFTLILFEDVQTFSLKQRRTICNH